MISTKERHMVALFWLDKSRGTARAVLRRFLDIGSERGRHGKVDMERHD